MAEEKLGPTKEFLKGAEARVRTVFHTIETIWTFLVLPLLGMILWIVLVTTFTKFSSTDALLVVLAFSVWYCTRWLGERIGDRFEKTWAYLVRIIPIESGGRLDVYRNPDGTYTTVLSGPEAKIVVDPRGPKGK